MKYSNPRTEAVFTDWPIGRLQRTTARFWIESDPKHGERGMRTTINPKTGRPSAPKKLTYASKARIVDGDDGKTYIAMLSSSYRLVSVMQSNMQFQAESINESGDPARYAEMIALFEE